MEPPGTAPGSDPLIPRAFITIVPVRGHREYRRVRAGFEEGKRGVQGPRGSSVTLTTTLPDPLTLTVWVADDLKLPRSSSQGVRSVPVTVGWGKFRGPGVVTFAENRLTVEKTASAVTPPMAFSGKATTTATFSEPGEYVLRVVANDASGDGGRGFQCCWSNAQVKVSVKPAGTSSQ